MFTSVYRPPDGCSMVFGTAWCREYGNTMAVATFLGTKQIAPGMSMPAGHLQSPTFRQGIIHGSPDMLVLVIIHPTPYFSICGLTGQLWTNRDDSCRIGEINLILELRSKQKETAMHIPVLFACPACFMNSPFAYCLSLCIGGVLISYSFLKPHVRKISKIWGWPCLNTASYSSLLLLFLWPFLFCWVGSHNHPVLRVITCTTALVLCNVYLWLRGCWLLQQCHITTSSRQVLFLSILGPGMLIAGIIVGQGIVGLVLFTMSCTSMAVQWFFTCAIMGGIPVALLYCGLQYVFGESTVTSDNK